MLEETFKDIINNIKDDINNTKLNIMINANINLVNLYFRLGKILYDNSKWGNKFIDDVAVELKLYYPRQKGFSVRNLKYIKSFYNEYKDDLGFVQLVAQIPWKHNIILIQKIKDKEIRKWYIQKCIEEGWVESILLYQINTNLYQRQAKAIKHNNFEITLKTNSELAENMMKEPYIFDLIELTSDYKEKELQGKMLEKLKNVLLELGSGFSYVGNEYKVTVENQDFYIDLLFYHIKLKCYIAVELKNVEFIPEFGSKMGFYLSALDEKVKDESDNDSIGIILCPTKNNEIVDVTLKYINKPVGVSEYKILDTLPKNISNMFPTEQEINLHIDLEEGDKNE